MRIVVTLLLFSLSFNQLQAQKPLSDDQQQLYHQALSFMGKANLSQKIKIAKALSAVQHDKIFQLFTHWSAGTLYYIKNTKALVIFDAKNNTNPYHLLDEKSVAIPTSQLKKVRLNNRIRVLIKSHKATFELNHSDPTKRMMAAENIAINSTSIQLLKRVVRTETNQNVLKSLQEGIAIYHLNTSSDQTTLTNAIKKLAQYDTHRSKNALTNFLDKKSKNPANQQTLVELAQHSIKQIEQRIGMYQLVEKLFFGLSLGSVLLLIAMGLSITFGISGVINMAHGEIMMMGAYTTFVMQQILGQYTTVSLFLSIPMAFLVAGSLGVLIERLVIRHLYNRPLETLLATFGISLILQQIVRDIFSPLNQNVLTPQWMQGIWVINDYLGFTYNRLYIIIFALLVFLLTWLVMNKTGFGLKMRATSQNRAMSQALGINTGRVDSLAFGFGSGIAGVAGVALSQITNVGPGLGQSYIIESFMVVVLGGVGSLWGSIISAFSIGGLTKFFEPLSGPVLSKIIILMLIILIIQKFPQGLFSKKSR